MAAGHKWALRAIGSTLTLLVNQGSGWVEQSPTITDATYSGAGRIAALGGDLAFRLDDFGGGHGQVPP